MSDGDESGIVRDLQESWSKSAEPKSCPKCGQPMVKRETRNGGSLWTCFACNTAIPTSEIPIAAMPMHKKLPRYFVHGAAFAGLFVVLEVFWILSTVFLIIIGNVIGLIIGAALLILIIGSLNSVVSRFVWGFSMQYSFSSIFFHGLVLFVILLAVEALLLLVTLVTIADPAFIVGRFIIGCFVNGFIGEKVAERWVE